MTHTQAAWSPVGDRVVPTVSIAIRAYRRHWLAEAIESVLGQTFTDLELVIYDDAGDLDDVVSAFDDDPRVRYHRAERPLGASGRFAAAIELCRGRYVGLLDDDDRYEPEFLERVVAALEDDPGAGIAFTGVRWQLDDRVIVPPDPRPPGRVADSARDLLSGSYDIQPSLMLIRRAALDEVTATDPIVDGIAADLFLNIRFALEGWGHVLVDAPLVTRRWHDDQLARGPDAHDITVATWSRLAADDAEFEALRTEQLARALLRRAAAHLASGDNAAARADIDAAARADPAAWRRPRALIRIAARSGPLARLAAGVWSASTRRRRDLPPEPVRNWRERSPGLGRDMLTLGAGTVVAHLLLVGISPVITRLFTPAEIGAAAVLTGALGISVLSCLTLDWAIPLARGRAEVASVGALCLLATALVSGVAALTVALGGDALAQAANVPEIASWLWLVPLQVILGGVAMAATGLLMRRKRFGRLAAVRALQAAVIAATSVAFGLAGGGGGALAAATTCGIALYALLATTGALRGEWQAIGAAVRDGVAGWRDALGRWRGFAGWTTLGFGLNIAREAVVPLLIAALYGPAAAGLVFIAQRVLGAPARLAAESVSRAWYGTAAAIVRGGQEALRGTLVRVTRTLAIVGGAVLVLAITAGPPLFPIVFGQDFEAGGDVLLTLAPLYFASLVASPASLTLVALNRTRLSAAFTGARFVGAVVSISAADALGLSLTSALAGYTAAVAVASGGVIVAAWLLSGQVQAGTSQPNE